MRLPSFIAAAAMFFFSSMACMAQPSAVQDAIDDFRVGKPLPYLPDLNQTVYVIEAALICESVGALKNPNIDILLGIGACIRATTRMKVGVLPPRDLEKYIEGHVFKVVRIVWRPPPGQDQSMRTGWTETNMLRNGAQ